jgi:hypothetical protein
MAGPCPLTVVAGIGGERTELEPGLSRAAGSRSVSDFQPAGGLGGWLSLFQMSCAISHSCPGARR